MIHGMTNQYQEKEDPRDRFERKVDRSLGEDACHIWTAGTFNTGYGSFSENQRDYVAPRWIYQYEHNIELPKNIFIRHTCDNPLCVNLKHLTTGTQKQNMEDKVERKRQAKGENHGNSKISEETAKTIKSLRGVKTQKAIADEFGVSYSLVQKIHQGAIWGWLPLR